MPCRAEKHYDGGTIKEFVVGNDNEGVHRYSEGFDGLCCLQQGSSLISCNPDVKCPFGSAVMGRYSQSPLVIDFDN